MKLKSILSIFFFLPLLLSAQTVNDALRFSSAEYSVTARHFATGGGMSALGGDFGIISVNPASLGVYRKSEFTFTPYYGTTNTESLLLGPSTNEVVEERRGQFAIANLGVVFQGEPYGRWINTTAFSIGISRRASFNERFTVRGGNVGSITDRFIERSDGLFPNELSDFDTGLAFNVEAIRDSVLPDGEILYFSDPFFFENAVFEKEQQVERTGGITDFTLGWGANIKDKVHVGLSIGLPILNFREEIRYIETDPRDEVPVFNELLWSENLDITGVGFQTKLGVTYIPTHRLRVAAYIHTPVWMSLTDNYETEITYDFNDIIEGEQVRRRLQAESPSDISQFDYSYSTPWVFGGGLAYIVGKSGFFTADVDYRNLANGSFNLTRDDPNNQEFENDINADVADQLQSVLNVRLGTEWVLFEYFRLRGGLVFQPSPWTDRDIGSTSLRVGIGYRADNFFFDLAFAGFQFDDTYEPYGIVNDSFFAQPQATQSLQMGSMLLTGGVRF